MLIEKHLDKSVIQEKMDQKLGALTRQTQNSLKEIQENMDHKMDAKWMKHKYHLNKYKRTWVNK